MIWMRFIAVVALLSLGGCFSGEDELAAWIAQQKAQSRPKVAPLTEPKKFIPEEYSQDRGLDPFSLQRLTQALKRDSASPKNAGLIAPELARRKEALEAYPLDAMVMVGTLQKGNQPVALIRLDNLIYQVKVGQYIGQNYGKVVRITETEIVLREIVQDSAGDWTERAASLQLQEGKT